MRLLRRFFKKIFQEDFYFRTYECCFSPVAKFEGFPKYIRCWNSVHLNSYIILIFQRLEPEESSFSYSWIILDNPWNVFETSLKPLLKHAWNTKNISRLKSVTTERTPNAQMNKWTYIQTDWVTLSLLELLMATKMLCLLKTCHMCFQIQKSNSLH